MPNECDTPQKCYSLPKEIEALLYERHTIATGGLPFAELKQRSLINERARAADKDPDFSRLIREGLPQGK